MRHAHKGEGVALIHSALCYQQINKDAPFISSLSLFTSLTPCPSLSLPSTSAQQPIHLMQFPSACSRFIHATSHPLSLSLCLSRSRCTGDVILFQLDSPPSSLLPRSHSLLRFPLAAGSPQHSIPSAAASLQGWEGEEECRLEV